MITATWMLQTKKADFNKIASDYRISPVTARVIRNRGVVENQEIERYLHGTLKELYDPHLMKDMDKAAQILKQKIESGKRIRIIGDYDIDGVCATYILNQALKRAGAQVDYEIPDRIKDGYGVNISMIEAAALEGIDTIVTCDNGIAAVNQIARAKELGMTVVITDHHDIMKEDDKEIMPQADAVVDPKREGCSYPYPGICGGVVAWKLVKVLYEILDIPLIEWEEFLEFAAISTVGDVMKLQDENRIIVKEGLKRIAKTKNLGLRKLAEKNNLDIEHLSAYHIGFVIGPCLNAGGRLQTAKLALSLLLSQDEEEADKIALELKELNDTRKDMTKKGLEEAADLVDSHYKADKVLVVYIPDCHESLAGIIAGRLREKYQKPAFVLTKGEGCAKGSGRSIEQYHMFDALSEVKDLLTKFGGHPMAAGLSLEEDNIDLFRTKLNEHAQLTEEDFIPKLWIDAAMPLDYITESLVIELGMLEPFGQGNEKPQFAQKDLNIRTAKVMGKNRNVVRLSLVTDKGLPMDGLLFCDGDAFLEEMGHNRKIDIIYYPDINEYNGNKSLQAMIRYYKF